MAVTRVQYRERQRLTAADLSLEQDHRLGVAGRHHLTHHAWGVVRGLRVEMEHAKPARFVLTPGIAIDGYGRELLVPAHVALTPPAGAARWCVVLAYCEDPAQAMAGAACREDPAPRIRQRTACLALEEDAVSTPAEDAAPAADAQAAGALPGRAPWPVVVARVAPDASGVPAVDCSATRYVRHRAARLLAPDGRGALQLGLAGARDFYPFALATPAPGGSLERRWAIDRDGTVHFWRPLVVAGGRIVGEVALGEDRVLRIELPAPSAFRGRLQIEGVLDREARTVTATLRDPDDAGRAALTASTPLDPARPLAGALVFGAGPTGRLALLDAVARTPSPPGDVRPRRPRRRRKEDAPGEPPPPEPAARQAFHIQAGRAGGALVLRGAGDERAPTLQLLPAASLDPDPAARELHAVVTSKPDALVPATAVRISGGALDDSDTGARVSVGGRRPHGFAAALHVDGAGNVSLPREATLAVTRTTYLAPIGKEDPLLQELLPLAFLAGLRRVGRYVQGATVSVALGPPPAGPQARARAGALRRGDTLEYHFSYAGASGDEVKHCLEIIAGVEGSRDVIVRTLPHAAQLQPTEDVQVPRFTHAASKVQLQLQLLVARGGKSGVVVSDPVELALDGP